MEIKTNKSEFKNYEELIEFFDNPVIQEEIELQKSNAQKIALTNMLFSILQDYVKTAAVKSLNITWDENAGFHRLIAYRR